MPTTRLGSGTTRKWLCLIVTLGLPSSAILSGCGSSSHDKPVITSHPSSPAPVAPPITTDRGEIFNVTITTNGGQILVDKLEVEFNHRRGIHEIYGFYLNSYNQMSRIPFAGLKRVDFLRQMPQHEFDQAIVGREDQNLLLQNAFELKLTYRDDRQESFYAVIPMFRGEKDLSLWEFPMDSRSNPIQYIEFDR